MFEARVVVHQALHLSLAADCQLRGESLPSPYVSLHTHPSLEKVTTPFVACTERPLWEHQCITHIPNLHLESQCPGLEFQVWNRLCGSPSGETASEGDRYIGCARVDLSPLVYGLGLVSGWYNVVDFGGVIRGQLKISIEPTQRISFPSRLLSQPPAVCRALPTGDPVAVDRGPEAGTTGEDPGSRTSSMLFGQLRKNIEELDRVQLSLKQRLVDLEGSTNSFMASEHSQLPRRSQTPILPPSHVSGSHAPASALDGSTEIDGGIRASQCARPDVTSSDATTEERELSPQPTTEDTFLPVYKSPSHSPLRSLDSSPPSTPTRGAESETPDTPDQHWNGTLEKSSGRGTPLSPGSTVTHSSPTLTDVSECSHDVSLCDTTATRHPPGVNSCEPDSKAAEPTDGTVTVTTDGTATVTTDGNRVSQFQRTPEQPKTLPRESQPTDPANSSPTAPPGNNPPSMPTPTHSPPPAHRSPPNATHGGRGSPPTAPPTQRSLPGFLAHLPEVRLPNFFMPPRELEQSMRTLRATALATQPPPPPRGDSGTHALPETAREDRAIGGSRSPGSAGQSGVGGPHRFSPREMSAEETKRIAKIFSSRLAVTS